MSDLNPQASAAIQPSRSYRVAADPVARMPVPRRLRLALTYGVAGTVLFVLIYLIEGITRPGYNAWQQTISSLSQGPDGWIQRLDFALCGVSVLWMAYIWRKILKGGACAFWYPLIRGIEGAGLVAIAFFIQDPLHTACLIVIVNAMTIGLFVIAARFWKNPDWHGWVAFSIICGCLPMVFMPFFVIALYGHAGLTGYAGLFERLATNADTIWSLALLIPLWSGKRLMRSNIGT